MKLYYYLHELQGGSLSPIIPRLLANLYCFIFGHSVPCGTGGGLCERCYKHMSLNRNKDGSGNVDGGLFNPYAITLRDFLDLLIIRAKLKIWIRSFP